MIRQFKIQPAPGKEGGYLTFDFGSQPDSLVVLKPDPNNENRVTVKMRKELLPGDIVWQLHLTRSRPSFIIKYDDSLKTINDVTWDKVVKCLTGAPHEKIPIPQPKFIMHVHKIAPDGSYIYHPNPNVKTHIFDILDETALRMENYIAFKWHINAINRINTMSEGELRDTMYHFGQNPAGMTVSELRLFLGHPQNGLALSGIPYDRKKSNGVETNRSYLEYFVNKFCQGENTLIQLQTLAIKASIIKMPNGDTIISRKDNGYYIFGSEFLGASIDEVVTRLLTDKPKVEFLKERINMYDQECNDDEKEIMAFAGYSIKNGSVVEGHPQRSATITSKIKKLREEFRNFNASFACSDEEINKMYEEAEKLKYRATFLKMKNVWKQNPDLDYYAIKKMIEEKALHTKPHPALKPEPKQPLESYVEKVSQNTAESNTQKPTDILQDEEEEEEIVTDDFPDDEFEEEA